MPSLPAAEAIDPPQLSESPMYAHVTRVNNNARVIYTAGQVAIDSKGHIPSGYADQIRLSLANLDACLKSAGAARKDIVKLTYYIVNYDPTDRPHIEILSQFLHGHRPTTTLVPVPALALRGLLFEIEAVAAVRGPEPEQLIASPYEFGSTQAPVIVIGAGLSGLQAANDLQMAGVPCLVLEARERVGGKTWSTSCAGGKGVEDLGAAWTNDVNQPRVFRLVQRLGFETIVQNTNGDCVMQDFGTFAYGAVPNLPSQDQKAFIEVRDRMEELCHTIDLQNLAKARTSIGDHSVHQLVVSLGAGDRVQKMANIWTRAMLGKSAKDVSAVFFLMYCKAGGGFLQMRSDRKGGGQHLRLRNGMQSLSQGLAAALRPGSLFARHPVTSITQTRTGRCIVTTKNGKQFVGGKVILSVPTPLYQTIRFSPSLSSDKQTIASKSSLGSYAKSILLYSAPWWRDRGLCGLGQILEGPVAITRDTSSDADEVYALTCFIVGHEGQLWGQLSAPERQKTVLEQIDALFAQKCPSPTQILEQNWNAEEYSQGAPCPVIPVELMSVLDRDQWQPEGHLHFIGTETSPIWKGYMEGALQSGERGASEVLEALYGDNKSSSSIQAKL